MRVRISFETRQDEVMQGNKTTSEFEREVATEEEAYNFGYSVVLFHGHLFAGFNAAQQDLEERDGNDDDD
jgi:hypothetical protein